MKVYDADQVLIVMGVIPIASGFADGSFVEIKQPSQDFTSVVGTDGEVTRSKTNDRRATITFKLMQTSAANDALTALNLVDRNGHNGAGVVPLTIKDKNGNALYIATKAWVAKPPDVDFDRAATSREWMIECDSLSRVDGGNAAI